MIRHAKLRRAYSGIDPGQLTLLDQHVFLRLAYPKEDPSQDTIRFETMEDLQRWQNEQKRR